MGYFTRLSDTEAAYQSDCGVEYRMLSQTSDGNGSWILWPCISPPQPTYCAVPGQPGVYGFQILRVAPGQEIEDAEIIGYAMNLGDAAWPVEDDLIKRGVDLR